MFTAETLATFVLASDDRVDDLIRSYRDKGPHVPTVDQIIGYACDEIVIDQHMPRPSEAVIRGAWNIVCDEIAEIIDTQDAEKAAYERSQDMPHEYASERRGVWCM